MGVSLRYILEKPIEKESQMDSLNIRVYRAIRPDGSRVFQCKVGDKRGVTSTSTMELLVEEVMDNIRSFCEQHRQISKIDSISIDFHPYHDIECLDGIKPKRCVPLTKEETKTFWDIIITK